MNRGDKRDKDDDRNILVWMRHLTEVKHEVENMEQGVAAQPAMKVYNVGPITVTKYLVDWDDLEGSVLRRLAGVPAGATVYFNAEYTVTGPGEGVLGQFVKQARRAQVLWNKRLARVLGAGRRRRMVRGAGPHERQLLSTGVMFVSGKPMHPKGWPDVQDRRPRR